jgi:exopolysaccharide biosynthesis polyprenyl glycosylphosphotransferase
MSYRQSDVNRIIYLAASDVILTELALYLASWLRFHLPLGVPLSWRFARLPWPVYLIVAVIWLSVFFLLSAYDDKRTLRFTDELRGMIVAVAIAALVFAGTLYLSFRLVPRLLFIYFCVLDSVFLLAWRLSLRQYSLVRGQNGTGVNLLIVGAGKVGEEIGRYVAVGSSAGWHLVGYLDDDPTKVGNKVAGAYVLGPTSTVVEVVQAHKVDEIIIALPLRAHERLVSLVIMLQELAVQVNVVPDFFDLAFYRTRIDDLFGVPLIRLRDSAIDGPARIIKRLVDLTIAIPGLILAAPFMFVIALAVRCESPGPAFFRQRRVGENGRLFDMWKLRTMIQNAEDFPLTVFAETKDGRLIHKRPDDPRVTRIGHFLRRYSLDELPQLMNVIKGEMSLVGPRPELPWLVDLYEGWQRKRFAVPPGMTGWWQISGRSDKPMHLHVEDDLYYIQNYSILLDFRILLKTIAVVLSGKGAY